MSVFFSPKYYSSNMANVIDRKQAADLLNVSIRTIDRYIQKGTLQKEEINGRIFIHQRDLKPLLEQKHLQSQYLSQLSSTQQATAPSHHSEPAANQPPRPEVSQEPEQGTDQFMEATVSEDEHTTSGDVYKTLYEQLQEELKNKQERLEGANYRVGQLEGLLKESVPLLEYRKSLALEQQKREEIEDLLHTFEKENEKLNQTIESKVTEVGQLSKNLETERSNKKVFVIILIILFLLQPLWLIFPVS